MEAAQVSTDPKNLRRLKSWDPYQKGPQQLRLDLPFTEEEISQLSDRLRELASKLQGGSAWSRKFSEELDKLLLSARDVFYDNEMVPPISCLLARTAISRMSVKDRRTKEGRKSFEEDASRLENNVLAVADSLRALISRPS